MLLSLLKWQMYVFQSERAARKATVLQMATMYTVLGGTLVNLGVTFGSQGSQLIANGSFIGAGNQKLSPSRHCSSHALSLFYIHQFMCWKSFICQNPGVFMALLVRSMQRVKMLDKFEKMI